MATLPTNTTDQYKIKTQEQRDTARNQWQQEATDKPVPVGRGIWIGTKAALAGAAVAVPTYFATALGTLPGNLNKAAKKHGGKITGSLDEFTETLEKAGKKNLTPEEAERVITKAFDKLGKGLSGSEKVITDAVKNTHSNAKTMGTVLGLGTLALSAYGMVKRRKKIIGTEADNEVLKIDNVNKDIEKEEALEKLAKTEGKLSETKSELREETDHGKHAKDKDHEKKDHEKKDHETKGKHHDDDTRVTEEDAALLNERLKEKHGKSAHGEEKGFSDQLEAKSKGFMDSLMEKGTQHLEKQAEHHTKKLTEKLEGDEIKGEEHDGEEHDKKHVRHANREHESHSSHHGL